ncbi:MAG: outer membrane lipoprotein-sorting protein [Candidatus Cyclobacteriaceae bacterium M3_2C_046]
MKKYNYLLVLLTGWLTASGQDATEIIKKADQKMRGESSYAEMTMSIIRPDWTRQIAMKSWTKDNEYSLILITAPARDKGMAYLKRGNEIWNWQPSIDRVVKLPPSMMSQSWMGSDFTNDDLVQESSIVTDYTHKLMGDTTIEGRDSWHLELTPKEEAAVVWGKIEVFIDKAEYLQLLTRFYDEDMYLVNTMTGSDIKMMDDRLITSKLTVVPADEDGHKTVMEYNNIDFNININQDFFSIQNMKKLRP